MFKRNPCKRTGHTDVQWSLAPAASPAAPGEWDIHESCTACGALIRVWHTRTVSN